MQHRHVKSLPLGGATVVAIARDTLEAIDEATCWSGPTPQVAELLDEFVQAIEAAPGGVVVDMRDTRFLDHASVSVVFRLARLLAEHNKPRLICCSREVKGILDVCRLNTICLNATDLEEAVAVLAQGQKVQA